MAYPFGIRAPLTESQYDALIDWAECEFRDPQDQAVWFIVEGLKRAGALPLDWTTVDERRQRREAP